MIIFRVVAEKPYPRSEVYRVEVPDDKVKWEIVWPEYAPQDFTSLVATDKPWADSNNFESLKFKWNSIDGLINRRSFMGLLIYSITFMDKLPIYPTFAVILIIILYECLELGNIEGQRSFK